MRFAIIGLLCAGIGHAQAAEAIDVTWPQGWEVQSDPVRFRENVSGVGQVAVSPAEEGKLSARITFLYMPDSVPAMRSLPAEMQFMLETVSRRLPGLTCDAPTGGTLVGAPALEATCRGKIRGSEAVFIIVFAYVRGHVINLTGLMDRDRFETHLVDFNAVRASLRFAQ